jgi:hypothetical protein
MATYKYDYDCTELCMAAMGACEKVVRVYKDGDRLSAITTSEDLTTEEKVAVETAMNAIHRRLEKE